MMAHLLSVINSEIILVVMRSCRLAATQEIIALAKTVAIIDKMTKRVRCQNTVVFSKKCAPIKSSSALILMSHTKKISTLGYRVRVL